MKLVIKAGIVVAILAVQVVMAFFLVNWLAPAPHPGAQDSLAAAAGGSGAAGGSTAAKSAPKAKAYDFGAIHPIPDLILNPRGSQGRRVFKISLSLEYDPHNPELAKELEQRTPFMRDYLINTFSAMTEDSLSDISYREGIRDSLGAALNRFLSAGAIDRVLFQDYIRQ
jgi:flagellar basal body-associated protein FliL